MKPQAAVIEQALQTVAAQRALRAADPALAVRVMEVKRFQQARFASTYADLLATPRYASASRFFLEQLYGTADFAERDAQFARVVPTLVRLFPTEIVGTVATLGQLHALSELLDTAMAKAMTADLIDDTRYAGLWRAVGRADDRERQIAWMLDVGYALDAYTRKPLLRHTLRLMRVPAQRAGLSALQHFLETGFETFRAIGGADAFLQTIGDRERALAARLFEGGVL